MTIARMTPVARCGRNLIALALTLCSAAFMATPSAATPLVADGYVFTNFELPDSGSAAGDGTNINGIANDGATVGFSITDSGSLENFIRNPDGTTSQLGLNDTAMALGINDAGDVVGTQNGAAFLLPNGGPAEALTGPTNASAAFGINDHGNIVGQYSSGGANPGFFVKSGAGDGLITINAPSGPNTVNAQGVNDNGVVVGYYIGSDGQDHGFSAETSSASGGLLTSRTGSAIADPLIPNVAGEPGATFVFSQILGVNDGDFAVGYYGDSTGSEHGFLFNLSTDTYTFIDDPAMQFDNGAEVTQITGINDLGEIAGFYSDAAGVFHGFTACPIGSSCSAPSVPEPSSLALECLGLATLGFALRNRSKMRRLT